MQPGREGAEVAVLLVPECSEGRDAPWYGTRQRSCSSAHSRTCGDWRPCLRRSPGGERGVQGMNGAADRSRTRPRPGRGLFSYFTTNQRTNERTFKSNQRTSSSLNQQRTLRLSLYSEDGVVIYRSPRSGRGIGEADVIVRPDWTGPSWGPPFPGGVSARPGKSAHSTRVWIRQEGIGAFWEAEELERRTRRFGLKNKPPETADGQ